MAYERCGDDVENEFRIVILGAAGSGKSKTANTLLGSNDSFEVGAHSYRTIVKSSYRCGTKFTIVDTPGLFGLRDVNFIRELDASLHLTQPGPHVFILCIPMVRLTDQANKAVKKYLEHFGEKIYDFLIIAFTFIDQWELDIKEKGFEPDLHAYFRTLPDNIKHLLQRCENRYFVINNRKTGDESLKQAKQVTGQIIECISNKHEKTRIYKRSNGCCMRVWRTLKQIGVGICRGILYLCRLAESLL
ncbi:unnamed protein product [Mytilus coruscus]|uniref:AIG1-type G domain-containing protein n=1 Tax=Mytilus coruscus TaxID=42192 RepID=A0A6J8CK23_MYTCO|nr:unnamed protein product [Mytilus coruscus]